MPQNSPPLEGCPAGAGWFLLAREQVLIYASLLKSIGLFQIKTPPRPEGTPLHRRGICPKISLLWRGIIPIP